MSAPSSQKCVLLIDPSLGCLSCTVQSDVCARFDTLRLLLHSCAKEGKFLCFSQSQSLKTHARTGRIYDN